MSLSDANVVQENSGTMTSTSASVVVTLPSGTTAGSTLVVLIASANSLSAVPTGFVLARNQSVPLTAYYKSDVAAGETSWTFTLSIASAATWYVAEVTNIDLVDPFDAGAGNSPIGAVNGTTVSSGTTGINAGLSTVAFAMFSVPENSGDTVSWSGYTNDFSEVIDVSATIAASGHYGLAVARKFTEGSTGTFECTATLATTNGSPVTAQAQIVVFRAADSPIVAPLALITGFDWSTIGGVASQSGDTSMLSALLATPSGTFGTNYLIQSGSARNSSSGLRIVQSGAAAYVRSGNLNAPSGCFGFNVRVVSATGTVNVVDAYNGGASTIWRLQYDSAASKFGVQCGTTGTVQWQSGTTATNTWVWIDVRLRINATTWTADWRIETAANTYTDQTQATLSGQSATGKFYGLQYGYNGAQTMTADFDDVVMSKYQVAYPLGPHEVKLLTVDPAGTPTISGTTTNFGVFTGNTAVAAWNAVNARNAVDEVPPTISAAADGATQTAVAASDYMEFPMSTYTCTATEFINGVRMLAPMWSATAAAADLAIRGWDGTTETALATVAATAMGAPTAVSSTAPVWRCAMWQSTNGWTQAELDAAALRVGFSTDATPDIGVQAIYLEVAIGKTRTMGLFGDFATIQEDPTRLGVVSVTTTAPDAGGDSSLYYETSGTPTTVPVPDATTVTTQLNAEDQPTTNYIAFYPPPEGVPDA